MNRTTRSSAALVAAVTALVTAPAVEAAVFEGKARDAFTGKPRATVRIHANQENVTFFKPRHFNVRCNDGTSGRAKKNDAINAMALALEERPNGRKRFEQHLQVSDPSGDQVKVDIFGSFNPAMRRARGRFRIRIVQAGGGDAPAGTKCTTGITDWRAKRAR